MILRCYSLGLGASRTIMDALGCSKTLQDAPRRSKRLLNHDGIFGMLWDALQIP